MDEVTPKVTPVTPTGSTKDTFINTVNQKVSFVVTAVTAKMMYYFVRELCFCKNYDSLREDFKTGVTAVTAIIINRLSRHHRCNLGVTAVTKIDLKIIKVNVP